MCHMLPDVHTVKKPAPSTTMLIVSSSVSIGLIAFLFFFREINEYVDSWGNILYTPIYLIICLSLFPVIMVWSAVHAWRRRRLRSFKTCLPFVIQLVALILAFSVPWFWLRIELDFRKYRQLREEVVRKIETGELKTQGLIYKTVTLPTEYVSQSRYKTVDVRGDTIFFEIDRSHGLVDFSAGMGFLYTRSDRLPEKLAMPYKIVNKDRGKIRYSKKIAEQWYWVELQ